MADAARRSGFEPRDRILVAPRGIDLRLFYPPAEPSPSDTLRIITTRRLRPVFRHDTLLRAIAALRRESSFPVRADIVGEGSERNRLERLARDLGIGDVVYFHGWLPKEAIAEQLRGAHVFVSLSRSDGLSTSLVEALACGLFPIVSDIPANRVLVRHGSTGLCVDGDDPGAVRLALQRAYEDTALREEARRQTLELVRSRYDIRRNAILFIETARHWLRPDSAATGRSGAP